MLIFWSQEETPSEFPYEKLPNFSVKRVHYLESKGVGWARHTGVFDKQLPCRTSYHLPPPPTGATLYGNQKYLLQLDSHHRFIQDWDEKLLEDLGFCLLHSPKPILTAYVIPYVPPGNNYEKDSVPRRLVSEKSVIHLSFHHYSSWLFVFRFQVL